MSNWTAEIPTRPGDYWILPNGETVPYFVRLAYQRVSAWHGGEELRIAGASGQDGPVTPADTAAYYGGALWAPAVPPRLPDGR